MDDLIYLTSIRLKNFQCHLDDYYEFDAGLNIISGSNSSGKSSLIRAIYWVFTNKPLGSWMCPIDSDGNLIESSVEIQFSDGFNVKKIRGKESAYIIGDDTFTELGTEIPNILTQYIGNLKLELGKQVFYPNFHLPGDTPFMVSSSAPVRGSLINYFTGFSTIEHIKKRIQSDVRNNKQQLKGQTNSYNLVLKELENYNDLKTIKNKYGFIKKRYETWLKTKKRQLMLEELYKLNLNRYKLSKRNITTDKVIQDISNRYDDLYNEEKKLVGLKNLFKSYHDVNKQMVKNKKRLETIKSQIGKLPKTCITCGQLIEN